MIANRYFWGRVQGDAEDALGVTDESFDAFDALVSEHGLVVTDDDDVTTTALHVALRAPAGFIWALELYDNGDDAGVIHWIYPPDGGAPLRAATCDSHPIGPALRWEEAEKLRAALTDDVAPIAPLLLWGAIGLAKHDSRDLVRARLSDAWLRTGLVSKDIAVQLAAESSGKRRDTEWRTDARLGWTTPEGYRRLGGWSEEEVEVFRRFLAAIGASVTTQQLLA